MTRSDTDQLALDRQVCFALYAATRAMTAAYRPVLSTLGLTYPQYLVMLVLWETNGLSVGEIGERLFLDSGTLTPLLKRLQEQGLLVRRRRPRDERQVEIRLTPMGKALRDKAATVPENLLCRARDSGVDLLALRDDLKAVTRTLHSVADAA